MMTFKEYVGVALTPANQIAKKHGGKVKTIMAKNEKGKKVKHFYVEHDRGDKDKAILHKLTTQALKAMPGSPKQKELIKKLNHYRKLNGMKPISEADGCWDGFKKVGMKKKGDKMVPNCVPENVEEGKGPPESFEAQFKRRVVKTTKPEHKEKGYNWRIKGKDRPEISIKLYKSKPGFDEFKKQLRRVAGHEFG